MDINQLITPERVQCISDINSKKRALESLSNILSSGVAGSDPTDIFHQLIERERLGSTGLGHGVALPHGRIATHVSGNDIESIADFTTLGCFIKLNQGIDFDSPDHKPVDLLFGLLVPAHCTDEHLQILAGLAKMFSDINFCEQLRQSQTSDELYTLFTGWFQAHQVAS